MSLPIIALTGPTASGKSAAAMAVARALRPQCAVEIISVDSALVYRGMDVGTAKPSAAERSEVPHHLLDLIEPTQAYSAARFVRDAKALVAQIAARGALPLLVGGTMLYFKALREGLDAMPEADPALRAALDERAAREGWPALHAELSRVDPVTAARLAPHDAQRIQRALEVWQATGRPLSSFHGAGSAESTARPREPGLHFTLISLEPTSRVWLHDRIAQRFDAMLATGLLAEVDALRRRGALHPGMPSMRCVGYRQAWEALEREGKPLTPGTPAFAALRDAGIAATRQLAKRQLTWLRSMPERRVVDAQAGDAAEQVVREVAARVAAAAVHPAVRTPPDPLPPPQLGPAAWRGADLAARDDWILPLDGPDIEELERAAHAFLDRGGDVAQRLGGITTEDFALPRLAPRLSALRNELLHGRGFALVRRLPVEGYSMAECAALFMGLGAHLGRARSQNGKGHVLGHVRDLGLASADPHVRLYQTNERQTFHTDSCDIVGLLCLREARRGGDSLLVSALTLFNVLRETRPDLAARLLRPMAHDRRGEVPAGQQPFFMIPVLSWHAQAMTVFYQRQYIDSAQRFEAAPRLQEEDVQALDAFDALAEDPELHLRMRLAPGDLQFVHNHVMLHDRTAFEDFDDPSQRRHLLRLWLAAPGARELPAAFAARYGSLEVGDRGGIVVPGMRLTVPLPPVA